VSDKTQYIKESFQAGARGYITKDQIPEDIVEAIRQVLAGKIYLSRRLAERFSRDTLDDFLTYGS
jgi:DNA-binding NarL/FixJ family response regulator